MQTLPGGAAEAVRLGLAALADGDGRGAESWFSRAHRLLPGDPSSALLLASSLSQSAPAKAESLLGALLEKHSDFGAARIALAAVRLAQGHAEDAASLLHVHLSSAAPPPDPTFAHLALRIAEQMGLAGWIGVDCDGRVSSFTKDPDAIDFRLDSRQCLLRQARGRIGGILPASWRDAAKLSATLRGKHLLGSPIDLRTRRAASGVVEMDAAGNLRGWAWMVADPDAEPRLQIVSKIGQAVINLIAIDGRTVEEIGDGVVRPRHFHVPAKRLGAGKLRVTGPDGHDLLGSPLSTNAKRKAAPMVDRDKAAAFQMAHVKPRRAATALDVMRPLPVAILPPLSGKLTASRIGIPAAKAVDIIIPVFCGVADLSSCLNSVLRDLPRNARIVLVDDSSRDEALRAYLKMLNNTQITILRHRSNRGFPAAANTGMRYAGAASDGPRDVVLLNPDTLVTAGWLARMSKAAYARADIGSVTPLTNDGTLTSYPNANNPSKPQDNAAVDVLGVDCAVANAGRFVELPTALGFCMFIRHDCLEQVGLLREHVFAQGYGEETDWSLRARHLGWRHVADTSTFVAHKGGASFGSAGRALRARNMTILERLHPGANKALHAFILDDRLASDRRRVDERRWRRGAPPNGAVVLITHAQGGGVERLVQTRAASWQSQGVRPIILKPLSMWPPKERELLRCSLADGVTEYPNLVFNPAADLDALAKFLTPDKPRAVELHQMMGHSESLGGLAALLGVPLDIHVHDYALICPRVTLCSPPGRYCGEPQEAAVCERCVLDHGDRLYEGLSVAAIRARSARIVSQSRHVHTATAEAARRVSRYMPAAGKIIVAPLEEDGLLPAYAARGATHLERRICVPGAIGDDKGFQVLLDCAHDAARRRLNLYFTVVGHTRDDALLMDTGRVFVTGKYREDEAVSLIETHRSDLGFLPSIWPETWCYALTLLWRAGLWPVVFDLGAQAERVAARGVGTRLPVGLPASRINDILLGSPADRINVPRPLASAVPAYRHV